MGERFEVDGRRDFLSLLGKLFGLAVLSASVPFDLSWFRGKEDGDRKREEDEEWKDAIKATKGDEVVLPVGNPKDRKDKGLKQQ